MTAPCIRIGRDVRAVSEDAEGIELEGRTRLQPGRMVELVEPGCVAPRRAVVWSWYVTRVGTEGPTFRGVCRWA